MVLEHVRRLCYLKLVVLNVKLVVIKVSKVIFWLPYKLPNHYYCTCCQTAIKEKGGSVNCPIIFFLETIQVHQK
jgi:hypothetical protein